MPQPRTPIIGFLGGGGGGRGSWGVVVEGQGLGFNCFLWEGGGGGVFMGGFVFMGSGSGVRKNGPAFDATVRPQTYT